LLCYTYYGDYMKSRGFTLVELLAVITILALLGLLIVPVISNVLSDNKTKLYNVQINNIEEGAKSYVSEHIFSIDIPIGTSKGITLGKLKNFGYVADDIVDPLTKEEFSNDMIIIISNTNNGFSYKVCSSGVFCENVDML